MKFQLNFFKLLALIVTMSFSVIVSAQIDVGQCHCHGNANAIFNIPMNVKPKVITKLGTNPEFGNSHALTPVGFFEKLQNRYNSSQTDKRFLDGVFRAMGYTGFGEATSDMFISTKLPQGVTGNLGYGSRHGTVFATIEAADEKDLLAFRIRAKNGCEFYFMKTCGNHFFTCSC